MVMRALRLDTGKWQKKAVLVQKGKILVKTFFELVRKGEGLDFTERSVSGSYIGRRRKRESDGMTVRRLAKK